MKRFFIILGSIGVVVGLLMFHYGIILIAEYHEYRSILLPCKYDREVSCIPPMQYFHYMSIFAIPITLASLPTIAYGLVKWKYDYVYMSLSAFLLVGSGLYLSSQVIDDFFTFLRVKTRLIQTYRIHYKRLEYFMNVL